MPTAKATRVVICDRHASHRERLRAQLEDETDIHIVAEIEEAEDAIGVVPQFRPDVLLVEAEPPAISVVELGRLLRESLPELKVIVLTASQEAADVSSLATKAGGADAYLLSDAQKGEIASAIRTVREGLWVAARAIAEPLLEEMLNFLVAERSRPLVCPNCGHEWTLNRDSAADRSNEAEGLPTGEAMEFGELRIDEAAALVVVRGQVVHLTPIEMKLLLVLARNAGRVLSHQVLLRRAWGYDFLGPGSLIPMAISRLRAKIERDPSNPTLIATVRGVGYRFDQNGI